MSSKHSPSDSVPGRQQRADSAERPTACAQCNKTFATSKHLRRHTRDVHCGRRFSCKICGLHFKTRGTIKRHKDLHTGFTCKTCGHRAGSRQNLVAHRKKHTGEKSFRRPLCDKSFAHKSSVARHLRLMHDREEPVGDNSKPLSRMDDESESDTTSGSESDADESDGNETNHQPQDMDEAAVDLFLKSLLKQQPPFGCPLRGCGKSYHSHQGITLHMRNNHSADVSAGEEVMERSLDQENETEISVEAVEIKTEAEEILIDCDDLVDSSSQVPSAAAVSAEVESEESPKAAAELRAMKKLLASLTEDQMKYFFSACSSIISPHNVLLFVGRMDESVSQKVWSIIDQQAPQILHSDLFLDLERRNVLEIIRRNSFQDYPMLVYETCLKWAKAQIRGKLKWKLCRDNIRKVMDPLLPHIRFPLMDLADLERMNEEASSEYYKILTDKEMNEVLKAMLKKNPNALIFQQIP